MARIFIRTGIQHSPRKEDCHSTLKLGCLGKAGSLLNTIGGNTLARSPDVLAQLGRGVSMVDITQPQNLIQA